MALRSHHSSTSTSRIISLAIGSMILLMAGTAAANRITLVATVNNQSVLLPAHWAIFKLEDKEQRDPVAVLPRHSGTVQLSAGQYIAKVTRENTTRHTEFRVESNTDKTVRVALD